MRRKRKTERKCRYCGKKLDAQHYFFCNDECMEKFQEEYIPADEMFLARQILGEWMSELDVGKRVVLPQCEKCARECKIKIKEDYINQPFTFECLLYVRKEDDETPNT